MVSPKSVVQQQRRRPDKKAGVLRRGEFELDVRRRIVVGPAGPVRLSPKQAELLELLMRHSGRPVSRGQIMSEVWGTSYLGDTRTLDVHICWLRKALEPDPDSLQYLFTIRNVGYVFYPSGRASA